MLTTTRGNAAEAAVLRAFIDAGFDVSVPFGNGQPYDLVVQVAGNLFLRVQCKSAWPRDGVLMFNSRTTDHGQGRIPYDGLADIFGVFFPPLETVYLVPVAAMPSYRGRLRLDPPRNNQRSGIRLAADFEINTWTHEALGQLVGSRTAIASA